MSSATSKTSLRLWLISTTPRPRSASRRTSSSTCSVWATPSAAVGSSRMTTLEFHSTARAIATVCRWPPERLATCVRTELSVRTESPASVSRGPRLHGRLVEHARRLLQLAAEEHVVDDVEVVAQREVLVDDLDAEGGGCPCGPCTLHRLAVEDVLTGVEGVDAGDALDQGALAGAVVADQRGDLARRDVEVDAAQHVHGAEALLDPAQAEQRLRPEVADGRGGRLGTAVGHRRLSERSGGGGGRAGAGAGPARGTGPSVATGCRPRCTARRTRRRRRRRRSGSRRR